MSPAPWPLPVPEDMESPTPASIVPMSTIAISTPTPAAPQSTQGTGGNNTLYLFTFLTTLLLLLAVSCGIIFRSFVLRRRLRQRVEAAIAAGILTPESNIHEWNVRPRRKRRDFGEKPKMFEVALDKAPVLAELDEWSDMLPVSVTKGRSQEDTALPAINGSEETFTPTNRFAPSRLFRNVFLRSPPLGPRGGGTTAPRSDSTSAPQNSQAATPARSRTSRRISELVLANQPPEQKLGPNDIAVSVVIAMPNSNEPQYVPSFLRGPAALVKQHDVISPESSKGKTRLLPGATTSTREREQEETELPEIAFGVWIDRAPRSDRTRKNSISSGSDGA